MEIVRLDPSIMITFTFGPQVVSLLSPMQKKIWTPPFWPKSRATRAKEKERQNPLLRAS